MPNTQGSCQAGNLQSEGKSIGPKQWKNSSAKEKMKKPHNP